MFRFSLLSSGSSGNATWVATAGAKILIDNGLSYRELCRRAEAVQESLEDLAGVFVTHEHGDHVRGVGVLARKLNIPVYITPSTFENLPKSVGQLPDVRFFESGETVELENLSVQSFRISHDAADPVSFVIRSGAKQLGIAADLGQAERLVKERLKGSHALVLESNYCKEKLRNSSYPAAVRQRIASSSGHLSNADMNSLLKDLLHDQLELVVIVHISQENNTEALAESMAARVLEGHRADLVVAQQDEPTALFTLAS